MFPHFLGAIVLAGSGTREVTRNTILITNNHPSFALWLNGYFVKYQSLKILSP